jgi:hypothetical protein
VGRRAESEATNAWNDEGKGCENEARDRQCHLFDSTVSGLTPQPATND